MNGKQRRQDRRKWKYNVVYDIYDSQGPQSREEYDAMWDWCVEQWGNKTGKHHVWREKIGCVGTHWQFNNEQAYLLFVLRFGAGK